MGTALPRYAVLQLHKPRRTVLKPEVCGYRWHSVRTLAVVQQWLDDITKYFLLVVLLVVR